MYYVHSGIFYTGMGNTFLVPPSTEPLLRGDICEKSQQYAIKHLQIQEFIPVGCVPPACLPYPIVLGASLPNPSPQDAESPG